MSLQTWFANLEHEAVVEVEKLGQEAVVLAETVWKDVQPVAEDFLMAIGQIAIGAVLKQAPLVIAGSEKFGAAVAETIQTVEAQGKAVAVSDAQLAVQAAYHAVTQAVKAKTPTS